MLHSTKSTSDNMFFVNILLIVAQANTLKEQIILLELTGLLKLTF